MWQTRLTADTPIFSYHRFLQFYKRLNQEIENIKENFVDFDIYELQFSTGVLVNAGLCTFQKVLT